MAETVYMLGALTTLACAILLLRGYFRTRRTLLLWSGLCFAGLTVSNSLVIADLALVPDSDYFRWRLITAAAALMVLLYGLIWESK